MWTAEEVTSRYCLLVPFAWLIYLSLPVREDRAVPVRSGIALLLQIDTLFPATSLAGAAAAGQRPAVNYRVHTGGRNSRVKWQYPSQVYPCVGGVGLFFVCLVCGSFCLLVWGFFVLFGGGCVFFCLVGLWCFLFVCLRVFYSVCGVCVFFCLFEFGGGGGFLFGWLWLIYLFICLLLWSCCFSYLGIMSSHTCVPLLRGGSTGLWGSWHTKSSHVIANRQWCFPLHIVFSRVTESSAL